MPKRLGQRTHPILAPLTAILLFGWSLIGVATEPLALGALSSQPVVVTNEITGPILDSDPREREEDEGVAPSPTLPTGEIVLTLTAVTTPGVDSPARGTGDIAPPSKLTDELTSGETHCVQPTLGSVSTRLAHRATLVGHHPQGTH